MTKRVLSLLLAVALIAVLAVPVSAAEDSVWIELLEYSSIQSNGENWFTISGTSGSLTIPMQGEKRLRKIDMLLWNPTNQRPSSASVTVGSTTTNLDVYQLGSNMCRIIGYLPNTFYEAITVNFKKSSALDATYELLSCKVTAIGVQEYVADAEVYLDAWGVTDYFTTNYNIPFWCDSLYDISVIYEWLARVHVYDWQKFDSLSIWGSATNASVESIRVSIGTTALDFNVNYIDVEQQDAEIFTDVAVTPEYGKYLYNITVDLTGVDRTLSEPMYIYFTGSFNSSVQAYFNCQYVNGSVFVADTSEVTWWTRFTSFMRDLFGADGSSGALDDLGGSSDSITQDAADIHAFEQSQQAVLDSNFSAIQTAVTFTNFAAALTFVQRYSNMAFAGISDYSIVLTLPLFLGLFFYLCSRIPGVTRWKSPPPRSKGKGGGKP